MDVTSMLAGLGSSISNFNLGSHDTLFVLIIMAILLWRSQATAEKAIQLLAQLLAGQQVSVPKSITLPPPAPHPSTLTPPSAPVAPHPAAPAQPVNTSATAVMSPGFISWLKSEEGFSANAYPDYKQYSIGYGTKATSSTETITEAAASQRLIQELTVAVNGVESFAPNAPLGVKQALSDLTYNAGPAWEGAGLGAAVKAGDWEGAKPHLLAYNHAGGEINAGLTKRRTAEVAMFDKPL